ncbi:MAG: hypothetical protein Q9187_004947 [Circinaria calcarea]
MAARNVEDLIDDLPSSDNDGSPSPGPAGLSDIGNSLTRGSSSDASDTIVVLPRLSSRIKPKNSKVSSSPNPRRRVTRGAVARKKPNYDMKYHPMDVVTRPNAKRTKVAEAEEDNSPSPSGEGRKTRSKSVGVKKVKYDISFHHLDDNSSSNSQCLSSRSETSGVFNRESLFTQPIEDDWLDLSDFDRRVYLLQRGSPIKGTAIPLKWSKVAEILISEKYLTRKQLKDWGGEVELRQRYERVRLQMEAFFGADKEPENRKDWKVYQMEGFEVYDLPSTYPAKPNGKGWGSQAEATDEREMESEDEMEDIDDDLIDHQLGSEIANRHLSARYQVQVDGLSDEPSGSMHEVRDELMDSIDEVTMTEGEVGRENEHHLGQLEVVDIVLSDRANTSIAASPLSKDWVYSTEAWQTTVAPMASVIQTSGIEGGEIILPVASIENESAHDKVWASSDPAADTSIKSARDDSVRGLSESAALTRDLKGLFPHAAESFDAANPRETSQTQHTTPLNSKKMKRTASSAATFTIHEDPEGTNLEVNERVALHPISPATDIPKENFGRTNHDDLDLPSRQLLNDWGLRDRTARANEATDVSASAVLPGASQTSSSSTRRRPVFQPLALDYNLDVVIEVIRITPRATSVPTGASSGISTVTTGTAAQNFIEGSIRRQRLARARAEDWMND